MNILYDYQAFMPRFGGGIASCFFNLINNLPLEVNYEIGMLYGDSICLENTDLVRCKKTSPFIGNWHFPGKGTLHNLLTKYIPVSTQLGRNQEYVRSLLASHKFDLFHATNLEDYYLNDLNGVPLVITIHDMIAEHYNIPDHQIRNKQILAKRASHIITVSENSKNEICEILGLKEDKVSVIYHGGPQIVHIKYKRIINEPYLLYVGGRDSYKSFDLMIKELKLFFNERKDIHLICTGRDFNDAEKKMFMGYTNRIHHVFPTDKDMQGLYANAECLIFPSQYEGFGIPILEAYANKCPVLLNNKSCFPEVAASAAIYFDLTSENSNFLVVLRDFFSMSNEKKNELIEKQLSRLSFFSWEKSAYQLTSIYQKVLDK